MMRRVAAIGLVSAVVSLAAAAVAGQSERPRSHAPRTPWGAPDLQGTWTGSTLTPLERPKEFTGKAVLAPEEAAALEARARERNAREPQAGAGDPGTYNQIWFDPSSAVVPDRRTSLIVDPPDGRLPFTPEGRALAVRHSSHYGTGPRDNPEDLDTGERCLTDGVPIPYWTGYNNNYQIVQTPQHVMIRSEMYHNVRVIPLDNRARTPIPQWMGESRARWEGDTLVVETSGFLDRSADWWATLQACRQRDARLRVHDDRPGDVHAAVDGAVPAQHQSGVARCHRGTDLRVRLPRRKLQPAERAARSEAAGEVRFEDLRILGS
jgi:hypothetical protein